MLIGRVCGKEKVPDFFGENCLAFYINKELVHSNEYGYGVFVTMPYESEDEDIDDYECSPELCCSCTDSGDIDGYILIGIDFKNLISLSGSIRYISPPLSVESPWERLESFLWVDNFGRVFLEVYKENKKFHLEKMIEKLAGRKIIWV